MREITILQDALVEARRITRDANVALSNDDLASRVTRIIAAQSLANVVLMKARAESRIAAQASAVIGHKTIP